MKILVPLDGSSLSESVLPLAGQLARRWQGQIVAVRVTEPSSLDATTSEEYLHDLKIRYPELKLRTAHEVGSPPTCIQQLATRENFELILMGTHGRDGLLRWLYGSVAEGVARHAPCPTMLVRSPQFSGEFRRILVPNDGSEESSGVARHIGRFLSPETRVTILHCSPTSPDQQEQLRRQVDGRPWMSLDVALNPAPQGIFDWLDCNDCDLIAMSTHGRDGLAHLWKGSVAEAVVRQANCPVLIFPSHFEESRV